MAAQAHRRVEAVDVVDVRLVAGQHHHLAVLDVLGRLDGGALVADLEAVLRRREARLLVARVGQADEVRRLAGRVPDDAGIWTAGAVAVAVTGSVVVASSAGGGRRGQRRTERKRTED